MAKEQNVTQIYRFDGKQVLMEIMSSSFAIGKVLVNIVTYNNQNKQTAKNSYYFSFAKWFEISGLVQSGIWLNQAYQLSQMAKQNNTYASDIYTDISGTPKTKLRNQRPSGSDEARVFRVYPSAKKSDSIMFSIAVGDGKQQEKGIIAPQFNTYLNKSDGNTVVASILVNYNELRGACRLVDSRIDAFILAQQLAGAYEYVAEANKPQANSTQPTNQQAPQPNQQSDYGYPQQGQGNSASQMYPPNTQMPQAQFQQSYPYTQPPMQGNMQPNYPPYNNVIPITQQKPSAIITDDQLFQNYNPTYANRM